MQWKSLLASVCAAAIVAFAFAPTAGIAAQEKEGTLVGFVADARSGEFIRQANVEVIGTGRTVEPGVDGDFSVGFPPGTDAVRFYFDGFVENRAEQGTVTAGETTQIDAVLQPVGAGESVDVIASSGGDVIEA